MAPKNKRASKTSTVRCDKIWNRSWLVPSATCARDELNPRSLYSLNEANPVKFEIARQKAVTFSVSFELLSHISNKGSTRIRCLPSWVSNGLSFVPMLTSTGWCRGKRPSSKFIIGSWNDCIDLSGRKPCNSERLESSRGDVAKKDEIVSVTSKNDRDLHTTRNLMSFVRLISDERCIVCGRAQKQEPFCWYAKSKTRWGKKIWIRVLGRGKSLNHQEALKSAKWSPCRFWVIDSDD